MKYVVILLLSFFLSIGKLQIVRNKLDFFSNSSYFSGYGLRCQSCSGGDYKCEGENDNGQSIECPIWATTCVYAKYYGAYEGGNDNHLWIYVRWANFHFFVCFRGPYNSSLLVHWRWMYRFGRGNFFDRFISQFHSCYIYISGNGMLLFQRWL